MNLFQLAFISVLCWNCLDYQRLPLGKISKSNFLLLLFDLTFFFFFVCNRNECNTVLLSVLFCLFLPHCLFCLHCYSLLYHPFGVHSPSLSQHYVHSTLPCDCLFKQPTFWKIWDKNVCSLSLSMNSLLPYYLVICPSFLAHKIQF